MLDFTLKALIGETASTADKNAEQSAGRICSHSYGLSSQDILLILSE